MRFKLTRGVACSLHVAASWWRDRHGQGPAQLRRGRVREQRHASRGLRRDEARVAALVLTDRGGGLGCPPTGATATNVSPSRLLSDPGRAPDPPPSGL